MSTENTAGDQKSFMNHGYWMNGMWYGYPTNQPPVAPLTWSGYITSTIDDLPYYSKLDENAIQPSRNKHDDAGLDLFALEDVIVQSLPKMIWRYIRKLVFSSCYFDIKALAESDEINEEPIFATKVKTGIAFMIPTGSVGIINDRSSIGYKLLHVLGGVIDAQYRGEVCVMLVNLSFKDYVVKKGDKVAQIVIHKCNLSTPIFMQKLPESDRGIDGFGSSDKPAEKV